MPDSLIQRLPSQVVDCIAAGEVIERPASVIKELVENAVDARARHVSVELEGGGLRRIVVADDGAGMSAADVRLCIERNATSKLRTADELFDIGTMGFRGEALSSIVAVSKTRITSRRSADAVATRIEVHGGEVVAETEVGSPVGTRIEVDELFYNTPARRKFMRSVATEQSHCVDAALRGILGAGPGHSLVVAAGKRRLVDIPQNDAQGARLRAALGRRGAKVTPFAAVVEDIEVSGYLGALGSERNDAKGLWIFVNNRFVRDRMLQRAVLDGFGARLPPGGYPAALVHIRIERAVVDVNVHPQKLEVRFSDSGAVFRAVAGAVAQAVAEMPQAPAPIDEPPHADGVRQAVNRFYGRSVRAYGAASPLRYDTGRATENAAIPMLREAPFEGALINLGDYTLVAGEAGWTLYDRRAAWLCRTLAQLTTLHGEGRPLVLPEVVACEEDEARALAEKFGAHGLLLEAVGPSRWALTALPAAFAGISGAEFWRSFYPLFRDGIPDEIAAFWQRLARHLAADPEVEGARVEAAALAALDENKLRAACAAGPRFHKQIDAAALKRLFDP